jgi:two-component sensor histidine kinase
VAGKILDSVGLNPEDCVGKTLYEVFPKTITDIAGDPDKQIFDDETVYYEVEYKNRIFANWGVPIKDETDKIIEGLVYAVDITDLKEKERELPHTLKEKTALLMEVQHRTRNNMQVINSMLALKSQHVTDEEVLQVFEDMRNRIFSMALVHRLLHRSKSLSRIDLKDYITELVIALRDSYWEAAIKTSFELDLESVSVLIDCALPCGLILNELIINSFKYAFPGDRKGVIRITLRQDETEVIHLTVLDNGVGIPESVDLKDTESLGLQLISILTDQLGAKLEFDPVDGVSCGLHFKDDLYFERV